MRRRRDGSLLLTLHDQELHLRGYEVDDVVQAEDLVIFRRATGTWALAWYGPDGLWYADDCYGTTLRTLLQVVLSHWEK